MYNIVITREIVLIYFEFYDNGLSVHNVSILNFRRDSKEHTTPLVGVNKHQCYT